MFYRAQGMRWKTMKTACLRLVLLVYETESRVQVYKKGNVTAGSKEETIFFFLHIRKINHGKMEELSCARRNSGLKLKSKFTVIYNRTNSLIKTLP